jgi:hypothetical protein
LAWVLDASRLQLDLKASAPSCYLSTVSGIFPLYWRFLGLPLSQAKGRLVDLIPFSLVETLVWIGSVSLVILIVLWVTGNGLRLKKYPRLRYLLISGPVLLMLMGLGQGAFPLSLAPSAWRTPLAEYRIGPPLPYEIFKGQLHRRENHLLQKFQPEYYESLTQAEIIVGCNLALDSVLFKLGLPRGRMVRTMKNMGPLTTTLGLSYGGPAFHDPFLGEMAMVHAEDMPSPKYWRMLAVCHEEAHAKGFTREMDAEILTQLALSTSSDLRYQLLGDIMFLRKSGEQMHYPEYLREEGRQTRAKLKEVESHQTLINFFRKLSENLGLQNSGGKYGSRERSENWNPSHPFFATVAAWLSDPAFNPQPNEK